MTFQASPCSQTVCVCHCVERLRSAYLTFLLWLQQGCCLAPAQPNTQCGIRGMLLHPAAVFCLGESCITPVVRQDPPPVPPTETQPSSQNTRSGPSAEVLAHPVYALAAGTDSTGMESKESTWRHWIKCSRPLVTEAERPGMDPWPHFPHSLCWGGGFLAVEPAQLG